VAGPGCMRRVPSGWRTEKQSLAGGRGRGRSRLRSWSWPWPWPWSRWRVVGGGLWMIVGGCG
jgi:hypothetical protein